MCGSENDGGESILYAHQNDKRRTDFWSNGWITESVVLQYYVPPKPLHHHVHFALLISQASTYLRSL